MAKDQKNYIKITALKPEKLPPEWDQNIVRWLRREDSLAHIVATKSADGAVVVAPLAVYEQTEAAEPRLKALADRGHIAATPITLAEAEKLMGPRPASAEAAYLQALEARDPNALLAELRGQSNLARTQQQQWIEDLGAWAKPLTYAAVLGGIIGGIAYMAKLVVDKAHDVGAAKQQRDDNNDMPPQPRPDPARGQGGKGR